MTLIELINENRMRHASRDNIPYAVPEHLSAETERRFLHDDFQYWAARCVTIRDKLTGRDVPFMLNRPQRRVLAILEQQRLSGKPIRLILLKARQWGGSTLVQLYMAWIQCVHRRGWHSLICAHVKNTAATIRGMYTKVLDNYPDSLWEDGDPPSFKPFERSQVTRVIPSRGCCVTIASAENQEGSRGLDISMAHLSEVAFWRDTPGKSGSEFAQAICSGIPLEPYTLIAMESTARGVGNFFHDQWLRATEGNSAYQAVFVPWYEIDIYSLDVDDPMSLWESMSAYERALWDKGLTLEQINWYHTKLAEMPSHLAMKNEYPTTPGEAFASTTSTVFAPEAVARLRKTCMRPVETGEIVGRAPTGRQALSGVDFKPDSCGKLQLWKRPAAKPMRNQYVVAVDVGGRTEKADYSVIAVFERIPGNGKPRVVAQWRGHIDHDLLAWKAAAIARFYGNALLVVESNTLESETDGDGDYILDDLGSAYANLYYRTTVDPRGTITERRPGFHTNRSTKALVINSLISHVRDCSYVEMSTDACNELAVYESTPQGTYAARRGCHDDILMTRAIGLYVVSRLSPLVRASVSTLDKLPRW